MFQHISSELPDINIRIKSYFNIQKYHILEHSILMTNVFNRLETSGICEQSKFNPNQIQKLSLSIKQNSNKFLVLIGNTIFCGSLPDKFQKKNRDICNVTIEIYVANFQNNYTWLQTTIHANISLRNRHLICPQVGDGYDHFVKTELWDYKSVGLIQCG